MTLKDLEIPLREFKRFGDKTIANLEKGGLKTIRDLIYYFPYRYEDLTKVVKIKDIMDCNKAGVQDDKTILVIGEVSNVKIFRSPRKKFIIVNATVTDETGKLRIIWFNQYYLAQTFKDNPKIALWGKLSKGKYGLNLSNPQFEKLEAGSGIRQLAEEVEFQPRILPVYSETAGIYSSFFEKNIKDIFENYEIEKIKDPIPQKILTEIPNLKFQILKLGEALASIHNPKSFEQIKEARHLLAFEEIFYIQLQLLKRKKNAVKEKAPIVSVDKKLVDDFLSNFDFELTGDQNKVLGEILDDLRKPYPMNRLLQGEVGAGKTLIAEIAALMLVNSGYQVLMMAPTEILARQHFGRILEDFSKLDFGVGLWVSKDGCYGHHGFRAKKSPTEILKMVSQKRINFLVGTHALLEAKTEFSDVGLVVIDEQQRFGIAQRKKLLKLSSQKFSPHILSMTATPIPRTLALTFYGDLDLSIIRERPKERKKVDTFIVRPEKREQLWGFVKKEIEKGHQTFIICPRVEVRDGAIEMRSEIKAVKEEYERIKKIFPEFNVEMMYGKMKAGEKENALKKLQNAETQILVASSVIEVGIDLPLATVIIVEGSERFGLSQLHQLRGRVGRSIHKSFCFLVMENYSSTAYERLKAIVRSDNALELAEKDLEIRGAGELLGERQSGVSDLAMQALKDANLVQIVKESSEKLMAENPELKDLPLLREEIDKRVDITG